MEFAEIVRSAQGIHQSCRVRTLWMDARFVHAALNLAGFVLVAFQRILQNRIHAAVVPCQG